MVGYMPRALQKTSSGGTGLFMIQIRHLRLQLNLLMEVRRFFKVSSYINKQIASLDFI